MTLSKTALSYILKDILIKRGVKNLLEFTDVVASVGIRLKNNNSLSDVTLQNSLRDKDKGFFRSNNISRVSFYKIAYKVIKKNFEHKMMMENEKDSNNFQLHFGNGDIIGRDKRQIISPEKDSFVEKFFWRGLIAIIVGVIIAWITHRLGFV